MRNFAGVLFSILLLATSPALAQRQVRDGQHDFDFEIGSWKTHLKRLLHPLSGSTGWVEYDGTTTVRKVWNGQANLVELEVNGPAGHLGALSLRLYNPDSGQWSLNFASSGSGQLSTPSIGEFKDGRGEFYDQETLGPRAILVRFVILQRGQDSCHFEQSFSDDGGKTWELNWIADDTRDAAGHEDRDVAALVAESDRADLSGETAAFVRNHYVDGYVEGTSFGTWLAKERLMDAANNKVLGKSVSDLKVDVFGPIAIARFRQTYDALLEGHRRSRTTICTQTWSRQTAAWMVLATHCSQVPRDQK
jgi:hypothetical protein